MQFIHYCEEKIKKSQNCTQFLKKSIQINKLLCYLLFMNTYFRNDFCKKLQTSYEINIYVHFLIIICN